MDLVEDVEILEAGTTALEGAWRRAQDGSEEDVASVRRISAALARYLEDQGVADLPELAREVAQADEGELAGKVGALHGRIERYLAMLPRQTVRILAVDDDPATLAILTPILAGPGREVRVAGDMDEARDSVQKWSPDLVILDLNLGASDGRDFLVDLAEHPETAAIPVLVLSGHSDPSVKTECFALGADKYLEKPIDRDLLAAAVSGSLRRQAMVTRMAQDDPLTGLPNRAAFRRVFTRVQSLLDRSRRPLSLALLDLDLLKDVNDELGHAAGDSLLRGLAQSLREDLRDADVIGRWGGDEFVVVFPDTEPSGARRALLKVQESFRKWRVLPGKDAPLEFEPSFSAGVILVDPHASLDEAMGAADRSLYLAKSRGRGMVAVGEDGGVEQVPRVLVVEDEELDAALIQRLLDRAGLRSDRVRDGESALERARAERPDLVVLDVRLPGMDGLHVLREMRGDPALRKIPVMILTGQRSEERVTRSFELGADDYIPKPLASGEFLARVRRLLRS